MDQLFALVRYNTDGSMDTTFGTNGIVKTVIGTWAQAYSVALQSDGKIVLAGSASSHFALARYNTDGSLDTTFGTNGIVTTSIGTVQDMATCVAIQSDGKIAVGGKRDNGANYDFALVRYWP